MLHKVKLVISESENTSNTYSSVIEIWKMVKKIKTDVDGILFELIIKKIHDKFCLNWTFFYFSKQKFVAGVRFYLLCHFSNFNNKILYILETNMRKSKINKIYIFSKYYMPLRSWINQTIWLNYSLLFHVR